MRQRDREARSLSGRAPTALAGVVSRVVMDIIRKIMIWIAIAAVVCLAILLPVIVVTGMFGGEPMAGTIALLGLVVLAFGVAWYVRTHSTGV
jgi:hypothetical protein